MTDRAKPWKRELWGVQFKGYQEDSEPMLLGSLWHSVKPTPYHDEPTHALLFRTRSVARSWCRDQQRKYDGRHDCCGKWLFKPVRIIETVRIK